MQLTTTSTYQLVKLYMYLVTWWMRATCYIENIYLVHHPTMLNHLTSLWDFFSRGFCCLCVCAVCLCSGGGGQNTMGKWIRTYTNRQFNASHDDLMMLEQSHTPLPFYPFLLPNADVCFFAPKHYLGISRSCCVWESE